MILTNNKIAEALDTIKEVCAQYSDCSECELYSDSNDCCQFECNTPEDMEILEPDNNTEFHRFFD